MKILKRTAAYLLAAAILAAGGTAAGAAAESNTDTGFSDVDAGSWYADAVAYVRDNGLMSGTSAATFEPDGTMTRAMLVTTLYRAAGSPPLENEDLGYPFADVPGDTWYADGVYWARQNGVVNGFTEEEFGPDAPVSREQIAAILWRYAGSPAAQEGTDFADEDAISAYAVQAVDWARANGVVNGSEGNQFLPQDHATRAEVATILRNYMTRRAPEEPEQPADDTRVLVAYFSATGNTENVANFIAEATGGDLFAITPAEPYTDEDLNWSDENSRVVHEYENPDERDTELVAYTPENWEDYDVVFVGYPIWWYDAAWPVEGFVEGNDFTGKTVIPFCTSSPLRALTSARAADVWLDWPALETGKRDSGSVQAHRRAIFARG